MDRKTFNSFKKAALEKDKSFKQSWDKPIVPLLDFLNEQDDIFSISSCSGRIAVMEFDSGNERKYDAKFLFVSHEPSYDDSILKSIKELEFKKTRSIWFHQEPVIIHIRFREMNEDCENVLKIFRKVGFKKSGIFGLEKGKILMEVLGLEVMKTIIMKEGELLTSEKYLEVLISEANKRVLIGHHKIQESLKELRNYFIRTKCIDWFFNFWFGSELSYLRQKFKKRKEIAKPIFYTEKEKQQKLKLWTTQFQSSSSKEEEEKEEFEEEVKNKVKRCFEEVMNVYDCIEETEWFKEKNILLLYLLITQFFFTKEEKERNQQKKLEDLKMKLKEEKKKRKEETEWKPIEEVMWVLDLLNSQQKEEREEGKRKMKELMETRKIFKDDLDSVYKKFL